MDFIQWLTDTHLHSPALTYTHWHSLTLPDTQWQSVTLTETHWHSLTLAVTHWHSLTLSGIKVDLKCSLELICRFSLHIKEVAFKFQGCYIRGITKQPPTFSFIQSYKDILCWNTMKIQYLEDESIFLGFSQSRYVITKLRPSKNTEKNTEKFFCIFSVNFSVFFSVFFSKFKSEALTTYYS